MREELVHAGCPWYGCYSPQAEKVILAGSTANADADTTSTTPKRGMTMKTRGMLILAGSIALALAIGLSAPASAADDSLSRVKGAGELVIGSTVTGVPTTFMDPKTGEMQGTMIDVAKYIAGKLGVKLRIVETPWASLMPSLMSKRIDLIVAAMSITEKRKEVIDFSDPVIPYCEGLVVKVNDSKPYAGLNDIRSLRVGVQVGTNFANVLEKEGIPTKIYDNTGDMMIDITNDRLDASIMDAPVAAHFIKTKPEFKIRLVASYKPVMCLPLGIGIRKEDLELRGEINKSLAEMKANGTIRDILKKWGQAID
jgi:polar amino acid transport system substrate-binding protein